MDIINLFIHEIKQIRTYMGVTYIFTGGHGDSFAAEEIFRAGI